MSMKEKQEFSFEKSRAEERTESVALFCIVAHKSMSLRESEYSECRHRLYWSLLKTTSILMRFCIVVYDLVFVIFVMCGIFPFSQKC